ncbi:MAG: transposase family protein [Elusimicrobia bacterium]|nr:MAG: transposase family protein [Elusimicrobiota bacterium]KAF0152063.1 MAG: transposase family protein [Elusimicrobiota bacterium]
MKLYAASDLHSNNSVLVVLDGEDKIVYEKRLPNEPPVILTELEPYRERIHAIAVGSTFNWYWLVDGLMADGYEVKLVNTAAVKVYEGLKYSADAHDARHLAHLLRLGLLEPQLHQPDAGNTAREAGIVLYPFQAARLAAKAAAFHEKRGAAGPGQVRPGRPAARPAGPPPTITASKTGVPGPPLPVSVIPRRL